MTVPSTGDIHVLPVKWEAGVPEQVQEHVAEEHDRDGQRECDPEAIPDLGRIVVAVVVMTVVGVAVDRMVTMTHLVAQCLVAVSWMSVAVWFIGIPYLGLEVC